VKEIGKEGRKEGRKEGKKERRKERRRGADDGPALSKLLCLLLLLNPSIPLSFSSFSHDAPARSAWPPCLRASVRNLLGTS
jgi:hypothetical protein